jgi:ATP-dependent DNA helicase RecG
MIELLDILTAGEDSEHQFKENINNSDQLATEMVAFSNGKGGRIFVGVDDQGHIKGLEPEAIRRLNNWISNAASQGVIPAINPVTDNIVTDKGVVVVITVQEGVNRPYQDKNGIYWIKSGADKRRATSREELQRLFQASGFIYADEALIPSMPVSEMDMPYFSAFFKERYEESLEDQSISLPQILQNMNLGKDGLLNLAGALLFGTHPEIWLPAFIVKAGAFDGIDLETTNYNDSRDISGKLADVYRQTVNFIVSNLHHRQGGQSVNSLGKPEIPAASIEELVANALIHRDYYITAPIRVFVFLDRVEIISPGHLPNNLTVENIKAGISNMRNPVLASFANYLIPYRGYGSGVRRALKAYPDIDFFDDRDNNLFKVVIKR